MSNLKNNLPFTPPYLKMDGDSFHTPAPLQYISRPELLGAAFYAAVALTAGHDMQTVCNWAIGSLAGVTLATLFNDACRKKMRKTFKSLENNRAIDTTSAFSRFGTSPRDKLRVGNELETAKQYSTIGAALFSGVLIEAVTCHDPVSLGIGTAIATAVGYQFNKTYILKKLMNNDWSITRDPPENGNAFRNGPLPTGF